MTVATANRYSQLFIEDPHPDRVWDPLSFLSPMDIGKKETANAQELILDIVNSAIGYLRSNNIEVTPPSTKMDGEETGDDRTDISQSSSSLAVCLVTQEKVTKMVTSQKDTFILDDAFNYCETTSVIPCGRDGSFNHARKTGEFQAMEHIDTAPVRVIIDAQKGDKSHSSTVVGKSSMIGSRISTPRPDLRLNLQIASYLQDGFLRSYKSPEPKYLPVTLGGSGCPALFDSATNLYLSVMGYRGGGYSRLYGSAVHEASRALSSLESGRVPELALVNRLREKREYFFGTYAEKILIPKQDEISKHRERLPMPLIEARASRVGTGSFQNRLIRAKLLVGQRAAEVELDFKAKLDRELFGQTDVTTTRAQQKEESLRLRKKFEYALSANTAFNNLLRKQATPGDVAELQRQGFLTSTSGVIDFSIENAKWLFHGGKSEFHTLEDLVRMENLFIRDEVSTGETLKVAGIELRPEVGGGTLQQRTVTRVGLYQIDQRQYEWCNDILQTLRTIRDEKGAPLTYVEEVNAYRGKHEWVNDDLSLIEEIRIDMAERPRTGSTSIFLITGDLRLSQRVSNAVNIIVYNIDPSDIIRTMIGKEWNQSTALTVEEVLSCTGVRIPTSNRPVAVYIDTGSLAAAANHYYEEPAGPSDASKMKRREYIESGPCEGGRRYSVFRSHDLSTRKVTYRTFYPVDTSWRPRENITRSSYARQHSRRGSATSNRSRN